MGNSLAYSYHTFIFPFGWDNKTDNKTREFQSLEAFFDQQQAVWQCMDTKEDELAGESFDEKIQYYKEYQYFHRFSRNAVFGFNGDVVRNYAFKGIHEQGHYYITKGETIYDLLITAIRIKIFNTGVALFILECENHGLGKNGERQDNVMAVKDINEYGRRITLPFLNPKSSLCADKLQITVDNMEIARSDFKSFIDDSVKNQLKNSVSISHVSDLIKNILFYGYSKLFTSNSESADEKFRIYPLLDDRMYVCCCLRDKNYVSKVLGSAESSELSVKDPDYMYCSSDTDMRLRFLKRESAEDIYELVFIDRQGKCSCKNSEMLNQQLKESLYPRWMNYGSMTFITNYSYIYVTTGDEEEHLIETFLSIYYQIYCLVIAQRASIGVFKDEIVDVSTLLKKHKPFGDVDVVKKIMDIQENFVSFDSQLCFEEVSPELQGIEIYSMMKEKLYIDREKAALKEQLQSLYEACNIALEFKTNRTVMIFTWISAIVAIASMLITAGSITGFVYYCTHRGAENGTSFCMILCVLVVAVLASAGSFLVYMWRYRRGKGGKKK